MTSTLLVLLLLAQAEGPDNPPDGAIGPPLPAGATGGVEHYVQRTPMLVLDGGEEFGVNLGAPVWLRLGGGSPGAGWVRREDWDSLSDWGQLVRGLKLGSDNAPVALWVGGLESYSLLSAHLTGTLGPLYTEAFSGVLGARLMGAEVSLDIQHLLFGRPRQRGRYTLALSAVHGWGWAGGRAPR
ncbi:hypothetical protein [Archangium violaceum]|uniref:hypothetical protein n=1 Tax=Archangium violaceum TaxID=83451 RepID=UPI003D2AF77E